MLVCWRAAGWIWTILSTAPLLTQGVHLRAAKGHGALRERSFRQVREDVAAWATLDNCTVRPLSFALISHPSHRCPPHLQSEFGKAKPSQSPRAETVRWRRNMGKSRNLPYPENSHSLAATNQQTRKQSQSLTAQKGGEIAISGNGPVKSPRFVTTPVVAYSLMRNIFSHYLDLASGQGENV